MIQRIRSEPLFKRFFLFPAIFALTGLSIIGCGTEKQITRDLKPLVETLVSSKESWSGDLYAYPEGQALITLLRITAPPGFRTPVHRHFQPGVAYVIKGTFECVVKADQTLIAGPGDSFPTTYGDVPHYCENIDKKEAVIIVAYSGVEGQAVTLPLK